MGEWNARAEENAQVVHDPSNRTVRPNVNARGHVTPDRVDRVGIEAEPTVSLIYYVYCSVATATPVACESIFNKYTKSLPNSVQTQTCPHPTLRPRRICRSWSYHAIAKVANESGHSTRNLLNLKRDNLGTMAPCRHKLQLAPQRPFPAGLLKCCCRRRAGRNRGLLR